MLTPSRDAQVLRGTRPPLVPAPGNGSAVPVVSMFYGIVVRRYYREHEPPHFHAEYAGRTGIFSLEGKLLVGDLRSRRAIRLIRLWALRNGAELEANWTRLIARQQIMPIESLE